MARAVTGRDWDGDGQTEYGFCADRAYSTRTHTHTHTHVLPLLHAVRTCAQIKVSIEATPDSQYAQASLVYGSVCVVCVCVCVACGLFTLFATTSPFIQPGGSNQGISVDFETGTSLFTTPMMQLAIEVYQQ